MLNRRERIRLYKHRLQKGLVDRSWSWNRWSAWFHKQEYSLQSAMYNAMLGEDNMRFMGQDLTATQVTDRVNSLLDCCPPTCTPCKTPAAVQSPCTPFAWKVPANKQEEEQKMSYNQIDVRVAPAATAGESEIATQRKFLCNLLHNLYYDKIGEGLRRAFGLVDDKEPKTVKERKERIAAGMYTINFDFDDEDFDEDEYHYGLGRGRIRWRDPAKKEDADGFSAAVESASTEMEKVKRIIAIKDADTGLAAVEAFEAKSFIPATVH